jgi:TRAP-type mannitol/chloroaromatic compound transport system permease small subunit
LYGAIKKSWMLLMSGNAASGILEWCISALIIASWFLVILYSYLEDEQTLRKVLK